MQGRSRLDWIREQMRALLTMTVGFLVVSLLDKSHLQAAFSRSTWGDDASAGRARVVLFLGVALMAGGLAGSLVRPVTLLRPSIRVQWLDVGL